MSLSLATVGDRATESLQPLRPRSLVFDLFGDYVRYRGGEARMQAIVELLGTLGVGTAAARVALARLRTEGWFSTRKEGRSVVYVLSADAWRVLDEGRERIFERGAGDWDGAWHMAVCPTQSRDRAERDAMRRTLEWLGFGRLSASSWLNPHDRSNALRSDLVALGAPPVELFTCRTEDAVADLRLVRRCWDLERLSAEYSQMLLRLEHLPSAGRLRRMPGREALRLRVALVAEYRRLPFRDPDLPSALLPSNWPGVVAHRRFLAAHDALRAAAEAHVEEVLAGHRR